MFYNDFVKLTILIPTMLYVSEWIYIFCCIINYDKAVCQLVVTMIEGCDVSLDTTKHGIQYETVVLYIYIYIKQCIQKKGRNQEKQHLEQYKTGDRKHGN